MYRKALVAIDGSPFSTEAVGHVEHVNVGSVVLLQVLESVPTVLARQTGVVADVPADMAKEAMTREHEQVRESLGNAKRALEALGITSVETVESEGVPGEEIVRYASEEGCDLIVMSTHGRTGIVRAVLGSVADHVVHNAKGADVLLVRPQEA